MPLELQPGPRGAYRIDGFRGGKYLVGGTLHPGSILIWPQGIGDTGDELTEAAFGPLFEIEPPLDLILIGTGPTMRWPDATLLESLRARGVGVDCMASQLAARTYNVLLGEGRQVGALLLAL